jgi:MoaA/NifB/PqqE/SkfB family radical SAM enzyme
VPGPARVALQVLAAITEASRGNPAAALRGLEPLAAKMSESALVQGAIFFLNGRLDPANPKYQLTGKLCPAPFRQIDVLDTGTHLCCASWLHTSIGNLHQQPWREVWNSPAAQAIRTSIHDGSYRYCNKTACPYIQEDTLRDAGALAAKSAKWRAIVEERQTLLADNPERVNLAYDRTCNLSCPSCRTEKYAADEVTRQRYTRLQESAILPMLRTARTVFITGSGDPFASKNFRQLMERLERDAYPDLRFIVMTNAMLLTPREWARFPALHGRVEALNISIDAATGPTHEALRRGARWDVMTANLDFAGELLRQGQISALHLTFTVQAENYREMGAACDLADRLDTTSIYFGRITNWGTFSPAEYQSKAVFLPSHPEHVQFLEAMRDPRLLTGRARLGNLSEFVQTAG